MKELRLDVLVIIPYCVYLWKPNAHIQMCLISTQDLDPERVAPIETRHGMVLAWLS
jgi:hypothetical protein